MRRRNWRFVITGLFFAIMAVGFFFFMLMIAPQSTDPAGVMRTAGSAAGTAIGISVVIIIFGLIGKKV